MDGLLGSFEHRADEMSFEPKLQVDGVETNKRQREMATTSGRTVQQQRKLKMAEERSSATEHQLTGDLKLYGRTSTELTQSTSPDKMHILRPPASSSKGKAALVLPKAVATKKEMGDTSNNTSSQIRKTGDTEKKAHGAKAPPPLKEFGPEFTAKFRASHDSVRASYRKSFRIAVCIVGGVRSFVLRGVYESIAVNLSNRISMESDVDAFAIVTTQPAVGMGGVGYMNTYESMDAEMTYQGEVGLTNGMKLLKPVRKIIVRESSCEAYIGAIREIKLSVPGKCCEEASFLQVAWRNVCFRLVYEREDEIGMKYNFIVHTRPDVGFFQPVDSPTGWHRDKVMLTTKGPCDENGNGSSQCRGPWNRADYFFIVPRGLWGFWAKAVSAWSQQDCGSIDPSPEKFIFKTTIEGPGATKLFFGSVPFVYKAFPAVLVRSKNNAECFRLERENQQYGNACVDWVSQKQASTEAEWRQSALTTQTPEALERIYFASHIQRGLHAAPISYAASPSATPHEMPKTSQLLSPGTRRQSPRPRTSSVSPSSSAGKPKPEARKSLPQARPRPRPRATAKKQMQQASTTSSALLPHRLQFSPAKQTAKRYAHVN